MVRNELGIPKPLLAAALIVLATFAASLWTADASSAADYEPNDNLAQAVGPLNGGVNYDVVQETTNDIDWFYFYTPGQVQMKLTATHLGGQCFGSFGAVGYTAAAIQLFKDDGSSELKRLMVSATSPSDEYVFTVSGAKKMYIAVFNRSGAYGVGCNVRFALSPAAALTTTPAPDSLVIQSCLSAQSQTAFLKNAIKSTNRKLASTKKALKKTSRAIERTNSTSRRKSLRKKARRSRNEISKLKKKLKGYAAKLPLEVHKAATNCTPQVLELIQNDALVLKSDE